MMTGYIFGGDTNETIESLARKRALAQAMLNRGQTGIARNAGEGIAQLGQALAGRMRMGALNKKASAGAATNASLMGKLLGGGVKSASSTHAPNPDASISNTPTPSSANSDVDGIDPMSLEPFNTEPGSVKSGIYSTANSLGVSPTDLATAISYETAGTFDPTKRGPTTKWGQHRGLIQFGEPQAKQYGVDWENPVKSQLGPNKAIAKYLRDTGVKPGMGLMDIYSAINAGGVGRTNRSDAAAGGAPGTVADKVNNQMAGHRAKAMAMFGGQSAGGQNAINDILNPPTPTPRPVQVASLDPSIGMPSPDIATIMQTYGLDEQQAKAMIEGQPAQDHPSQSGMVNPQMTRLQPVKPEMTRIPFTQNPDAVNMPLNRDYYIEPQGGEPIVAAPAAPVPPAQPAPVDVAPNPAPPMPTPQPQPVVAPQPAPPAPSPVNAPYSRSREEDSLHYGMPGYGNTQSGMPDVNGGKSLASDPVTQFIQRLVKRNTGGTGSQPAQSRLASIVSGQPATQSPQQAPMGAQAGNDKFQYAMQILNSPYSNPAQRKIAGDYIARAQAQNAPMTRKQQFAREKFAADEKFRRDKLSFDQSKAPKQTSGVQEYEYAKANGFKGSYVDFQQAKKGKGFSMTLPDGTTVQMGGAGGSGPADKKYFGTTGKNEANQIKDAQDSAAAAQEMKSVIAQMRQVSPKVGYTGPGGEVYGKIDDMFGFLSGDSGARGAFKNMTMDAQLAMTSKTKGAITDREMGMFKAAVPGLGQTPEGNARIMDIMDAAADRMIQRVTRMEQWRTERGSLQGFTADWDKYINANPLIIEVEGGIGLAPKNAPIQPKKRMKFNPATGRLE